MHPVLGNAQMRPADSNITVKEIIAGTLSMAAQARKSYGLDADRVLIITPPYDPALRESWKLAEQELSSHIGGKKIQFDWHHWDVWTIERSYVGGVPAEWLVKPGSGKAIVPQWAVEALDPAQLRDLAAGAMAMADYLENESGQAEIEGGL